MKQAAAGQPLPAVNEDASPLSCFEMQSERSCDHTRSPGVHFNDLCKCVCERETVGGTMNPLHDLH